MRLMKAIERLKRHRRKTRWYRVNMQNYARRTLDMIAAEGPEGDLRSRTTLGQVEVLRAMAGRS
ncbi:hypothetical protein Dpep_0040 [Dethiosulfovibrio peptidovorans DSM 11002]|uniref:Uncharacterized protein n=2 Tax=Dethiosulfovibrio TaxID=47054 RepID=D2Z2B6_9BACT|nr:hypothetical protein Dpep_0040 [Dethiosulfovibrio peptidovorans DSM 11002]